MPLWADEWPTLMCSRIEKQAKWSLLGHEEVNGLIKRWGRILDKGIIVKAGDADCNFEMKLGLQKICDMVSVGKSKRNPLAEYYYKQEPER